LGGLIIDVLIAYVVRLVLRLARISRARRWTLVEAKITSAFVGGGWVWNCPTAEIAYEYDFDGQTYSSVETIPYMTDSVAQGTVERFKDGVVVKVRVNPSEPAQSVLKQSEQLRSTW
jgi:Protein of unknown function (DUF3592)